jgi:hypothetical protein
MAARGLGVDERGEANGSERRPAAYSLRVNAQKSGVIGNVNRN